MRRYVILVVALGISLYAAWQWVNAVQEHRRLEWAFEARTIVLLCDLSRPGKYSGTLEKAYSNHHADDLRVILKPSPTSEEEAKGLLCGLTANLTIKKRSGETAFERVLTPVTFYNQPNRQGELETAVGIYLSAEGTYDLELDVKHPAPALAAREHSIEGRYLCCGLEWYPVMIRYGWAVILTVIGGVLLLAAAARPYPHHHGDPSYGNEDVWRRTAN